MHVVAAAVTWAEAVAAIGVVLTPIVVLGVGYLINMQLKKLEDQQWRSQELIAARIRFYREFAEPLNDLMCYFTFIGAWKRSTPLDVVELKRSLDRVFHTLSPFFGLEVARAYGEFMDECFDTFGAWGTDARLRTSFRRRREAWGDAWRSDWNDMFTYGEDDSIPKEHLERVKQCYNEVLARLVDDIQLTAARPGYASAQVVLNA